MRLDLILEMTINLTWRFSTTGMGSQNFQYVPQSGRLKKERHLLLMESAAPCYEGTFST